jgi:hypothetical protein
MHGGSFPTARDPPDGCGRHAEERNRNWPARRHGAASRNSFMDKPVDRKGFPDSRRKSEMLRTLSILAFVVASTAAAGAEAAPKSQSNQNATNPPLAQPLPQAPPQSNIPPPAAAPSQAPTVNGPVAQPHGPTNLR